MKNIFTYARSNYSSKFVSLLLAISLLSQDVSLLAAQTAFAETEKPEVPTEQVEVSTEEETTVVEQSEEKFVEETSEESNDVVETITDNVWISGDEDKGQESSIENISFLISTLSSGGSHTSSKVDICHIPAGNPANIQTITVAVDSVTYTAHLKHGDKIGACTPPPTPPEQKDAIIVATKIVCEAESDLPNWGAGGPNITSATAANFLLNNTKCKLEEGWKFQSAGSGTANPGDNTGIAGSPWVTSPQTNSSGVTTWSVPVANAAGKIWVREVMSSAYVPFTGENTTQHVSAEMYCSNDVINYDNYDFISSPQAGSTYYCVAFNALKARVVNKKPVITVVGSNPAQVTLGEVYTDMSATVFDVEDGVINHKLVTTGVVNTGVLGAYVVTYNATDSKNLAADTKTRTIKVVSSCSDGKDNDGDGLVDFPADEGCSDPEDNDENTKPVITLIGANPFELTVGGSFTEPGQTALDAEDGNITSAIVTTGTVNTAIVGVYTLTYNVSDSMGLAADTKTRTVKVNKKITQCNDGKDNDGDGKKDYPSDMGCTSTEDDDENDKPVITVVGNNPFIVYVGSAFVDPSATANDAEDGNITSSIVVAGTVNVAIVGTYTLTYNVSDSMGLAADTKTRLVNVLTQCADDIDNDNDGLVDFPADPGCTGPEDNDENSRPVISLIGDAATSILLGTTYAEESATVADAEEGDITSKLVISGGVNTDTLGSYTISYNATDSQSLAAITKTRIVAVVSECSDGKDNDNDGKIDFAGGDTGCTNPDDNDENNAPVITLLGLNPLDLFQNDIFVDLGATAFDPEDLDITVDIVTTGSVDTSTLGSYTLRYNVSDSRGVPAVEVTRLVRVNPPLTECTDGIDNDGDGTIDFDGLTPDAGCDGPEDNDENERPVITLSGSNPMVVSIGSTFTDPSATAADPEDGNITTFLVTTGTVNTAVLGNYTLSYNVVDSKSLAAIEVTRIVRITSSCSDGVDNDQDGTTDYPLDLGCDSSEDDSENAKPVITLLGDVLMSIVQGGVYNEPTATVADNEDGDITSKLVTTGSVNTAALGAYTITYNATDSMSLAADTVSRTVNIVSAGCVSNCGGGSNPPACSDGGDNDGDGLADFPKDPGCDSPQDNDEKDNGPVLTLLGSNPTSVTQGSAYADAGATAQDPEEGNISSRIIVTGSVNTNTIGAYTLTYNVSDSQGHNASPISRVVNVVPGGGGGGPSPLTIMNERLVSTDGTTVVVTWNTNIPATSRVVHGLDPVSTIGASPLFGYSLSTATNTTLTTTHSVTITDVPSAASAYFRPISTKDAQTVVGIELTRGGILGETSCNYLTEYMRLGANNNPIEVTKLQAFLRNFEGFDKLEVTGFFDRTTDAAVRSFQDKYASEVLTPWNLPANTGYVYYTTQKKVNEIYCQRAFPLSALQVSEVMKYRDLIASAGVSTGGISAVAQSGKPVITVQSNETEGVVAGAATVTTDTATVSAANEVTALDTKRNSGRIALADLLATGPYIAEKLTGPKDGKDIYVNDKKDSEVDGDSVSSTTKEDESDAIAAVGLSGGNCLNFSCISIVITLLFFAILVTLVYLYVRGGRVEEEAEIN